MATNLGTAYIRIAPQMDGVQSSIRSTLLGGVTSSSSAISGSLKGTVGAVAIGTALGSALVAGVKAVSRTIADTVSDIVGAATEQMDSVIRTKTALTQMGYETGVVAEKINLLKNNAKATAASVEGLSDGFLTLTASWKDIDLTADATKALSDAILAMGGTTEMVSNAITQIGQVDLDGPLDGETWRSLRNSGLIPVLGTIADMNGMSLADYKTKLGQGELTTRSFINSLIELDKTGNETQDSYEGIAKKVAGSTLSGSIETAKESITTAVSEIETNLWQSSGAGDTIISTGDRIANVLPSAFETVKTKVVEAYNWFTKFAHETGLDVFITKLGDAFTKLGTYLGTTLTSHFKTFEIVLEALTPVFNIISSVLGFIVDAFGWLIEKLAVAQEWYNSFLTGISEGLETIKPEIEAAGAVMSAVFNTVKGVLENVFGPIVNWFKEKFSGVTNAIKEKFEPITNFFSDVWNKIKDIFAHPENIGKDLVTGLWNGIKDMGKWVADKISGFGNDVLNALKSALGIHSPSRYTAEMGKYLDMGLAKGITKNTNMVNDAMESMAADALSRANITGVNVSPSISSGISAGSGFGANATSVNQYNTFNEVASTLDVKEASRLLGWQVATAI